MEIRLKNKYKNEVFKAMQDRFGYSNPMEVPKLTKITINMGLSEAKDNAKVLESAIKEIALISGQRPVVTKARKSRRQNVHICRQAVQHLSPESKRLQGPQQKLV